MAILRDLLKEAKRLWGDRYDYSLIEENYDLNMKVNRNKDKFPILCHKIDPLTGKEHGKFEKAFYYHIERKQGCPECVGRKRYTTENVVEKLKRLPQMENVTFEKVIYVNNKTNVVCTCHVIDNETGKEHGDFPISIGHAFDGEGCPQCRYIKSAEKIRRPLKEVIEEAKKIFGDSIDFSLITEYKNDRTSYPMICHELYPDGKEHGIFPRTFNNLIKGKEGCPVCGRLKCSANRSISFEEYVERATEVHNGKYIYLRDGFTNANGDIKYICQKHGVQTQDAGNHLYLKQGCPDCGARESSAERDVVQFITELLPSEKVLTRQKGILLKAKEELDIYVPSLKFAIEYNGLFWHSEKYRETNYHLNKTIACEHRDIRLFHLFEDEWLYKQDIVKSMLRNILGKTENKIMGRKCQIKEITNKEAKSFLETNHLQGYCNSKVRIGLFYEYELVSVMTFGKTRHFIGNDNFEWELLRFANKLNTSVIGGASKLLKYFIKAYSPKSIVSYADRRWSNGNLYNNLGFIKYNESKPNYYYVIGNKRVYRFNMRKQVLIKKYGCPPEMTEKEFCSQKGWLRIYDCGCLCYKLDLNI
jgi:hypothetical protein